MSVVTFRKSLINAGWRCFYSEKGCTHSSSRLRTKTGGIIVTGDEVLKGQVIDTNSYFLCKELYKIGVRVMAVSRVPDDLNAIAEEVKKFSRKYDYVLTTGGIGPTHDDLTYEAVAKAFGDKLHYQPELFELVLNFYKTNDTSHPALKMAHVPTSAKLTYGLDPITNQKTLYPNVSVKNVIMFPGVPHLCKKLFNLAKNQLFTCSGIFHVRELYLTQNEGLIVQELNDAVKKYPNVSFGSYPKFYHSYYTVKISMESLDESEVTRAFEYLKKLVPEQFRINFDKNPFIDKLGKINNIRHQFFVDTLSHLENFIKSTSPDDIFLYFDGGKNSTVLLHIVAALFDKFRSGQHINAIYVETNPKINRFVDESMKNYNLNLLKLSREKFRYFARSSSDICIVKGIRKTDPNASNIADSFRGLKLLNPLSDWSYRDVWTIIRILCLPYCQLYDQGYTSICQMDSCPNPNLKTTGPRPDMIYYRKAFELEDESLENA